MKISTKDWANLPLEKWNITTFSYYLEHLTQTECGCSYEPTGGGSKQQRWSREKGMLKNAQNKYGNAVLKRFIELAFAKHTPKPQYPYPSFTFMVGWMSDLFPVAQTEVAKEEKRQVIAEQTDVDEIDESWF
jgi:hypothetical protein